MTPEQAIFAIAGPICAIAAANAVLRREPLNSALSLTVALFALAVLYLSLGAPFLAVVQIAVYAGAIMVLLIFVIMLLGASRTVPIVGGQQLVPVAVVVGLALFGTLAVAVLRGQIPEPVTATPLPADNVNAVADALFITYLLPFEIASVLLLAALIAAVSLARKRSSDQEWAGRRR